MAMIMLFLAQFGKFVLLSMIDENMVSSFTSAKELFFTVMARIGIDFQVFVLNVVLQQIGDLSLFF
jgi:hypothetical protein